MKVKPKVKQASYGLLAALSLALGILIFLAVKTLGIFDSPLLFMLALLAELILLVTLMHSVVVGLAVPRRILGSIARSALQGAASDPNFKRFKRTRFFTWLARELDPATPTESLVTLLFAGGALLLVSFVSLLQNIVLNKPLANIDLRVVNLLPSIRTPAQTAVFRAVTFAANFQSVLVLVAIVVAVLYARGQRKLAGLYLCAAVAAEGSFSLIKTLVARPRPNATLSLLNDTTFSFPSGHVMRAVVLYGLLAYLLYRSAHSSITKLLVAVGYVSAIFLIGLSRIYLGVHYPSDVFGSLLFGGFLLLFAIAISELSPESGRLKPSSAQLLWLVPPFMVVYVLSFSAHFVKPAASAATPHTIQTAQLDSAAIGRLPLYSETLAGSHMEPISFIYVGTPAEIEATFTTHGWYKSDPSTLANTLRALAVGFQGDQYVNAPVTPSYLNAKPQDVAFQQPTVLNSLRQRHHTRLWRTDYVLPDGRAVWVATASLDTGVGFAGTSHLPTHHIDPNIDAERAYIIQSLGLHENLVQVVASQLGKNASGDPFYTDGRAELVLTLK